jgi:hypothetical protein
MPEFGEAVAVARLPESKLVTGSVVSLTFRSDLLDADGKKVIRPTPARAGVEAWGDATDHFAKPDWMADPRRSDPTAQVKGTKVRVDLEVKFRVMGTGPARLTRIDGVSDEECFTFADKGHRFVSDQQTVVLTGLVSRAELPGRVGLLRGAITWRAVVGRKRVELGQTGPHAVGCVLDRPTGMLESPQDNAFAETGPEQHVTTVRLSWALKAAWGKATEKECVDAVFVQLMRDGVGYHLGRRWENGALNNTGMVPKPSLHHYLWACNAAMAKGECHNIAASFMLACRILGVRGSFEVGVMYPWPSRAEGRSDRVRSKARSASGRPILGKYNERYLRAHGAHGQESLVFLDGSGAANNFEGVARYAGNALYAIGDDVFDRFPDSHDNASCYYTVRDMRSGGIRRRVQHVLQPDKLRGFFRLVFSSTLDYSDCDAPYTWKRERAFYWHDAPGRRP